MLLLWSGQALANAEGIYRADEGPELAAELNLRADGTYTYAMAVGALDEISQGHWEEDPGGTIHFVTEPKPVPPVFRRLEGAPGPNAPFLLVTWPNGRGIAGIDFRIGFEQGDPITDYTQTDGWQWPGDEERTPAWIELAEPIHGVASPRYVIAPSEKAFRFELVPNDLGTIDFSEAEARLEDGRLLLVRSEGVMKFVKAAR